METEMRPWGSFTVLDEGPGYKVKRIEVLAGKRLSLQSHEFREEHWTIVSGNGICTFESRATAGLLINKEVVPKYRIVIFPKTKHRIRAITDLVFIEVQLGDCIEDDIVRFEDDYGRAKKQ